MSFANTVLNFVCLSCTKPFFNLLSMKWGVKFSFIDCSKTENPPSNPKSIPPHPEKRESTFKVSFSSSLIVLTEALELR